MGAQPPIAVRVADIVVDEEQARHQWTVRQRIRLEVLNGGLAR